MQTLSNGRKITEKFGFAEEFHGRKKIPQLIPTLYKVVLGRVTEKELEDVAHADEDQERKQIIELIKDSVRRDRIKYREQDGWGGEETMEDDERAQLDSDLEKLELELKDGRELETLRDRALAGTAATRDINALVYRISGVSAATGVVKLDPVDDEHSTQIHFDIKTDSGTEPRTESIKYKRQYRGSHNVKWETLASLVESKEDIKKAEATFWKSLESLDKDAKGFADERKKLRHKFDEQREDRIVQDLMKKEKRKEDVHLPLPGGRGRVEKITLQLVRQDTESSGLSVT